MTPKGIPRLRAVVCGVDAAVVRLLYVCGFDLVASFELVAAASAAVEEAHPDVVVVDVATCGVVGLPAISGLREASPVSAVIVLSPFEQLRAAALEAGALAMVTNDDLRPLLLCLEGIRQAAHGGLACPCCAGATTAAVSGLHGSRVTKSEAGKGSASARGR